VENEIKNKVNFLESKGKRVIILQRDNVCAAAYLESDRIEETKNILKISIEGNRKNRGDWDESINIVVDRAYELGLDKSETLLDGPESILVQRTWVSTIVYYLMKGLSAKDWIDKETTLFVLMEEKLVEPIMDA
jgi:hypothetical protein